MNDYVLDIASIATSASAPAAQRGYFASVFPTNIHVCHFYRSKNDLLELMVPYFQEGLRVGDFCLWGVAAPLSVEYAHDVLDKVMGGSLSSYISNGQIEIFDVGKLYGTGIFDAIAVKDAFLNKVNDSRKKGWPGFRCDGMASGVTPTNWRNYQTYEFEVTRNMRSSTLALCSYDLTQLEAEHVIDVMSTHQACVLKKNGSWRIVEPSIKNNSHH